MKSFEELNKKVDWDKTQSLVPAIIQNQLTGDVLMLGYMNSQALKKTLSTGKVTFFSRTKKRLWTKGESSGNTLELQGIELDCDNDTLLVQAKPTGPTCHTGTDTCFGNRPKPSKSKSDPLAFLSALEATIASRLTEPRKSDSYTAKLASRGALKVAQKVGEEGVEVALAAAAETSKEIVNESADLLFHLMILLNVKNLKLADVVRTLEERNKTNESS